MGTEFSFEEFFEVKEVDGKKCLVAVKQMTEEQARQAYPYRPYTKYAESLYGGNGLADDKCLLLNDDAFRCRMCRAATKGEFIRDGICPDCDGRWEVYSGGDPHKKV